MSGLLIEEGNPWTPEVAGKLTKTTVDGLGPTFGMFLLQLTHGAAPALATQAEYKTHFAEITVKIVRRIALGGGQYREETIKPIDGMSATELLGFYALHGFPLVDGYFPIYWMQPNFSAKMSGLVAKHFDLGTADVKEIHVEVKLDATVVDPSMVLKKCIRNVPPKTMGQIIGYERSPEASVAAAQTITKDNLKVKDGTTLRGIHIHTDKLDEVRLLVNGTKRHTATKNEQDFVLETLTSETGGKNPQAGWFHIDFMGNDYGAQWDLNQSNRFVIEQDFNAATGGGYDIWLEKIMGPRVAPGKW